jgi:hypothetical protein
MKRDLLFAIGITFVVLLIGAGIFSSDFGASGASSVAVRAGTPVSFTVLARGTTSAVPGRINYVLTSPTQFARLWNTVGAAGAVPSVDFSKYTVLAVFAGDPSTTAIAVGSVVDGTNVRMVSIDVSAPSGACAAPAATAAPYEMVVVPASSLPLQHTDTALQAACPQ